MLVCCLLDWYILARMAYEQGENISYKPRRSGPPPKLGKNRLGDVDGHEEYDLDLQAWLRVKKLESQNRFAAQVVGDYLTDREFLYALAGVFITGDSVSESMPYQTSQEQRFANLLEKTAMGFINKLDDPDLTTMPIAVTKSNDIGECWLAGVGVIDPRHPSLVNMVDSITDHGVRGSVSILFGSYYSVGPERNVQDGAPHSETLIRARRYLQMPSDRIDEASLQPRIHVGLQRIQPYITADTIEQTQRAIDLLVPSAVLTMPFRFDD